MFDAPDILSTTLTYDSRNRLLSETTTLSKGAQVSSPTQMSYEYDELGKLQRTVMSSGEAALITTQSYNIRSWLTERDNSLFNMKLRYNNPLQSSSKATWGGDISEWEWKHKMANADVNTYAFTYDHLNRLNATEQYVNSVLDNQFVEQGLSYDLNGNRLSLKRYNAGTLTDDYTYTYKGNKLTTLNSTMSYTYDHNSNMKHDGRQNIDLEYNHLNLLSKTTSDYTTKANYTYLADGTKISVTGSDGCGLSYQGSLIYKCNGNTLELESATFSGGRIMASTSTSGLIYTPNYFVKDHLGSVRVVVDANGEVVERNDYTALGRRWDNALGIVSDNRYRFAGKEVQTTGGLNYYDFGARMYDTRLGRWLMPDPMADKYFTVNYYTYAKNNPMRYIDPGGKVIRDSNGYVMWKNNQWTSYAKSPRGAILKGLLQELRNTPTGMERFKNAVNSPVNIYIKFGNLDKDEYGEIVNSLDKNGGDLIRSEITIDTENNKEKAKKNNVTHGQAMSSTLGHELRHTEDANIKMQNETEKIKPRPEHKDRKEEQDAKAFGKKIIDEYKKQ